MRQINIRVDDELYENARDKAHELGVSLSDLIRNAVQQVCSNDTADTDEQDGGISRTVLEMIQHQLSTKDTHIDKLHQQADQLHQLIAMGHKERDRLSHQLSDMREQKTVWQRLKAVFVAEAR